MLRISAVRDLLDAALAILGAGAGRVELVDGKQRVRVGRLAGLSSQVAATITQDNPVLIQLAPPSETLTVRAPAIGVVSFLDNRTGRPFVEVGHGVVAGQTLAFITALDITTKVVAPRAGVVEEVLVDDGDGVEYNAPLLKILPAN